MKKIFAIFIALFVVFAGFHMAEPAHAATSKTKYVTASILNVRTGASTKYKVVTTIKKNQSVKVTQTKGSWDKVTVGSKNGWASNTYLTTKKPAAPKNLAAGLKTVGSNKQLILVTSNGYNTSSAEIRTFEKNSKGKWIPVLTTTGHIGKYGFTPASKMSEGGKKSPIGKYTIGTAFGRYSNPGTKLPYRKITSDDVWVMIQNLNFTTLGNLARKPKVSGKVLKI